MAINKVMFGGEIIMDLTDASAINPEDLLEGKSCYDRTGNKIEGNSKWAQIPNVYKSPISLGDFDIGRPESYLCHLVKNASSIPLGQIEGTFSLPATGATLSVINTSTTNATFTLVYDDTQQIAIPKITGATTIVSPIQSSSSIPISYRFVVGGATVTGYSRTISFTYAYSVTSGSESDYLTIHSTANASWTLSHTTYTGNITSATVTYIPDSIYSTTRYFNSEEEYSSDYVIPIANNTNYIKFEIDDTNRFIASDNSETVVVLGSANTAYATYGVDIVKVWYIASDAVMVWWTYQANATTRGFVYWSLLYISNTNVLKKYDSARQMFPSANHKLSKTDESNVPFCYSGQVFKYNFRDGEWAFGINYIRASINSAGSVLRKDAWLGEVGVYATASIASRLTLQTVATSRIVSVATNINTTTGADGWFEESHGNIFSFRAVTSASVRSFLRYIVSVSNDLQQLSTPVLATNNADFNVDHDYRWLGRLEDGNYVVHDTTNGYMYIYSCKVARTANASIWTQIDGIDIGNADLANVRLLKSGVLVGNANLYQITYTNGHYGIATIGTYTKQVLSNTAVVSTDNVTIYGHYAIPIGRFSDLSEGFGGADVIADLSTE